MKERPILFSAPMVRAILDGRKTQTRRMVKPQFSLAPVDVIDGVPSWDTPTNFGGEVQMNTTFGKPCPHGVVGDRLWVRESFAFTDAHEPRYDGSIEYRADHRCFAVSGNELIDVPHGCDPRPFSGPWSPSIHMPRWASRIALEITGVRVERLKEIDGNDAIAEGLVDLGIDGARWHWEPSAKSGHFAPWRAYRALWEEINGVGSWDANPWLWVINFRRVST